MDLLYEDDLGRLFRGFDNGIERLLRTHGTVAYHDAPDALALIAWLHRDTLVAPPPNEWLLPVVKFRKDILKVPPTFASS
jgi:hypothetical protein